MVKERKRDKKKEGCNIREKMKYNKSEEERHREIPKRER